jgi:hypothetical protein
MLAERVKMAVVGECRLDLRALRDPEVAKREYPGALGPTLPFRGY